MVHRGSQKKKTSCWCCFQFKNKNQMKLSKNEMVVFIINSSICCASVLILNEVLEAVAPKSNSDHSDFINILQKVRGSFQRHALPLQILELLHNLYKDQFSLSCDKNKPTIFF